MEELDQCYFGLRVSVYYIFHEHIEQGDRIALTFDDWSPKKKPLSFLGDTTHYISRKTWKLVETLLSFKVFDAPCHNAKELAKTITAVLKDWKIDAIAVCGITADSD